MKIQKGMLISNDNCWYVVVEAVIAKSGKAHFHCICDHANNIHSIEFEEVHTHLNLEEVTNLGWDDSRHELPNELKNRDIPYQVMLEVLNGEHDERFKHWEAVDE